MVHGNYTTHIRWIEGIGEDIQLMEIGGGESCVRKGRNGRISLRRIKPTVGCNASKRRRRRGLYTSNGKYLNVH